MAAPWSTQQLAEFLAVVSSAETEVAAAWATVERTAEALDAEVAAIVSDGGVIAAVGYPDGEVPVVELAGIAPGVGGELSVPGLGACSAVAVRLEHPPGATLVVGRCGTGLGPQEASLLRGIAHASSITMRMLSLLDYERSAREESARRQRRLEQLANEQAALRRVATRVARAAPPEAVFGAVAAEVGRLFGADVAVVFRFEPDRTASVVGVWSVAGVALPDGARLHVEGVGVTVAVLETGRPARTERFAGPPRSTAGWFAQLGARSGVGVPISVEGRLWGAVVAASTESERLPAGSETSIAGFTELVATAVADAQARMELRGFAEEQAALRRLATLVAQGASPDEVFAAVANEVGQLLSADLTSMGRYEPDGTVIVVGQRSGTGEDRGLGARATLGGWNVGTLVFETGRPTRIDDFSKASGALADVGRTWGARSGVGMPIRVEGRLWGFMFVASVREEPLPADTEARLAGFTELVATAIANAEAQAVLAESRARIVAAADAARRRIERDLHDGAQQRLVSLALQLRAAQAAAPPEADELALRLDGAVTEVTGALDELGEIARGLHPAVLAEGGLRPALKTLARRSVVPVRLDVGVHGRLPEQIELAAYYVVAEALTNTAKHAQASVVDVQVEVGDGVLRVWVRDDGRGGVELARGSGLVGLKDRVETLGGGISLVSRPGAGTHVQVVLPLDGPGGQAAAPRGRRPTA